MTQLAWIVGGLPADAGPPITRGSAQAAAQAELAKRAYHRNDPSWVSRIFGWVVHRLAKGLNAISDHAPGHGLGLAALCVVAVIVIVVVAARLGRPRRTRWSDAPLLGGTVLRAADHRTRAERYHREGRSAEAVREWLRAISRELEERGVLDPKPGRTADELCAEAGSHLPAIAPDLRRATGVFDAIWYGGRPAGPDDEALLRALDRSVAGSHRPLLVGSASGHADTWTPVP